jgi:hypothetical protein
MRRSLSLHDATSRISGSLLLEACKRYTADSPTSMRD